MESARSRLEIKGNTPCPGLRLEAVLVYIVKPLLRKIDTAEDIHGALGTAGRVPVAALNLPVDLLRLQPDARGQIKDRQIIQRYLSVPSSENVHVVQVYYSRVAKPNLGVLQKVELSWNLSLTDHLPVLI